MPPRRTNLSLLVALLAASVTGALAFAAGTPAGRAVVVAHGVAGIAAVVLSPWKSAIVRRGLRRRRGGTAGLWGARRRFEPTHCRGGGSRPSR